MSLNKSNLSGNNTRKHTRSIFGKQWTPLKVNYLGPEKVLTLSKVHFNRVGQNQRKLQENENAKIKECWHFQGFCVRGTHHKVIATRSGGFMVELGKGGGDNAECEPRPDLFF